MHGLPRAPHTFSGNGSEKNITLVIRALHRKSLNICDWFNRMGILLSMSRKPVNDSKNQRINALGQTFLSIWCKSEVMLNRNFLDLNVE